MSFIKSTFRHPRLPVNDLGLTYRDYEGALSTLCAGCGHDSITSAIIQACMNCLFNQAMWPNCQVLVVHLKRPIIS